MEQVKQILLLIFFTFNVSSNPVFDKPQESDSYPVKQTQPDDNVEIRISGELSDVSKPIPILENEDFEDLPDISVFGNQLEEEDEEEDFDDVQEAKDVVSPLFDLQNDVIEKESNDKSDHFGKPKKVSSLVEVKSSSTSDDTIADPYDFFPSNCRMVTDYVTKNFCFNGVCKDVKLPRRKNICINTK